MDYTEIRIELPAGQAPRLSDWLVEEGVGFQEADETTLDPPPPGRVRFHVYVPPEEGARLLEELPAVLPDPASAQISTARRDDEEWRDRWKAFFTTRRIGRLALVPSWEAADHVPHSPGEVALQIDPGRAFGTGGHESTRLCLRLIDGCLPAPPPPGHPDQAVLDVGCGSGVLAIAALLLWPLARATAIDIDPESVEVTEENAAINGVADRLGAATTPLAKVPGRFALVLANLTGPTLMQLADDLAAHVAEDGQLVLSGILSAEADAVAACYTDRGLRLSRHEVEGEWSALLLHGPDRAAVADPDPLRPAEAPLADGPAA